MSPPLLSMDNNLLATDFIRHGKHAKASAQQQQQQQQQQPASVSHQYAPPPPPKQPAQVIEPPSSTASRRREQPPQHIDFGEAAQPHVTQDSKGHAALANPPPVQTPYAKEAEMIVKEEREAKGKLPVYQGLERFKLLEKMGDGAFSHVYKAVDLQTGQKVAVKVVRKYELTQSQRANILKEVQIMRGINHPNVVKLISFTESQEHYFLVLELMEGGELFHQIVKLTYFSEHLARHVILQVAKAIRHLHEEKGVVHRDIKPENILFERIPIIPSKNPIHRPYDEEKEDEGEFLDGVGGGGIGRVKIADFGLSKIIWDEQTMTPCGTVGYTAPEIVKDERYSKSVDMWALGCVLYTLLCGFPPFYDESINVLTEKVARGYYTFLSPWWDDISASSKDLITHLLCVDPAQRYTIDEFLNHPWCKEPRGQVAPTPALRTAHYESPILAPPGARDGRSPGVATLKEAFDVTYAVHRMEEEGARRRAGYGAGGRGFLGGLNEEVDEEDDQAMALEEVARKHGPKAAQVVQSVARSAEPQPASGRVSELAAGRAGVRDQGRRKPRKAADPSGVGFELDLNNATLLGRRNHRRAYNEPSPLGQGTARRAMSPMQLD
ncbi:hypothetical protein FS837_000148 [Tulasnella sp. UAMH 9824]|nr:hypothetical protein FS837_000148 [Tulasnella sp. UAMH 9824]